MLLRSRVLVVTGVAALVALILWALPWWDLALGPSPEPPKVVVQALEAARAAPAASLEVAPEGALATVAPRAPTVDSSPSVEVCGVGRVPLELMTGPALEATIVALTDAALRLHRSRRDLGDDDWGRAIGLRLELQHGQTDAAKPALADLTTLASTTRDPRVYALAWEACLPGPSGAPHAACAGLKTRRWAQLDPGNAVPWMAVASDAAEQGDTAGVDEAMHRVASAERVDSGWMSMSAHVLARLDPALHPVLRLAMVQAVVSTDIARHQPSYITILKHCDDDALRDANRRERCAAISRVLSERGQTAMDIAMAVALARRLGMPAQAVERLHALAHAVTLAIGEQTGPPEELLSCRGVQGLTDWSQAVQHGGEIGAARRWAEARGLTSDMLVERHRTFEREMRQAAERAPPAASASK